MVSRIKRFFFHLFSLSVGEVLINIVVFFVRAIVAIGTIAITKYLALTPNLPILQQWVIIICGGVVITLLLLILENIAKEKERRKIDNLEIGFIVVGNAINNLSLLRKDPQGERKKIIKELLVYIETIVSSVLEMAGFEKGRICANLMVKSSDGEFLVIEEFGTELADRRRNLQLQLINQPDIIGAVKAFFTKEITYINDTHSDRYRKVFSRIPPYRSILSFPIICDSDSDNSVIGILNIDSELRGQFDDLAIVRAINIRIKPFLNLISYEQELFLINNK